METKSLGILQACRAILCVSASILCLSSAVVASAQEFSYVRTLSGGGGPQGQVAFAVVFDQQGNALVGGRDAAFVAKLDPTGQRILYRTFLGNAAADRVDVLASSADGSAYVAGANSLGGFLARLSPDGDTSWYRALAAAATALALDRNGNMYYASAGTVVRLDTFTLAAPGAVSSLAVSSNGTVWAAGDGFVARLDATGEDWEAILHLPKTDVRALTLDTAGTPYIAAVAGSKAFVARVRTDASGLAWHTELTASQLPKALAIAPDGTLLVSGDGPAHAFVTMIAGNGTIIKSSEIGGSSRDQLNAIAIDSQGNAWVAGSTGTGVPDVLLARTESISASIPNHAKAPPPSLRAPSGSTLSAGTIVSPVAAGSASALTTSSITLGTNSLTFGHGGGKGTLVIGATEAWTARTTTPWLHIATSGGTGSALFQFTYDANFGVTRTGTVSFNDGAAKLTVTQAGESYLTASAVKTRVPSVLGTPSGLAIDRVGNIYIADGENEAIEKWTAVTGQVTTLVSGEQEGPTGLAIDKAGNLYFTETFSGLVRKWTEATGKVTTLISALAFPSYPPEPVGVAVDGAGNVYIADTLNNVIDKWTAATGLVTTLISYSSLKSPQGIAVDSAGNVYIANGLGTIDEWIAATRKVTTLTFSQGSPIAVAVDLLGNVFWTDAGGLEELPVTGSSMNLASSRNLPPGLAVDTGGNVYFSELSALKKWVRATARVTTVVLGLETASGLAVNAGNVYFTESDTIQKWTLARGQLTTLVSLGSTLPPTGLAVDPGGNVYFADTYNSGQIKKWTATTGQVSTLFFAPNLPQWIAVDTIGNVYVVDTDGAAVRKWTAATKKVTPLVSTGLVLPFGIAVDAGGNLYIADSGARAVKKWTAATGQVTTLLSGAYPSRPFSVTVDGAGNVYFADTGYSAIKKWTAATGQVTTLFGGSPVFVAAGAAGNNVYISQFRAPIKRLTKAFVGPPTLAEPLAAGLDRLLPVLPVGAPLDAVSDQQWLKITSQANGVVSFSFTATTIPRTAHIKLLGQIITVNQTGQKAPETASLTTAK